MIIIIGYHVEDNNWSTICTHRNTNNLSVQIIAKSNVKIIQTIQ